MQQFSKVGEAIGFAADWGRCPKKRQILLAVIYGYMWNIWKARNDKIFKRLSITTASLIDNTLSLVLGGLKTGAILSIVIGMGGFVPRLMSFDLCFFCLFCFGFAAPCLL